MTEPTLFEMDLPRAQAEEEKRNAPKVPNWFPKTLGEMLLRGYSPPHPGMIHPGGHRVTSNCRECRSVIEWWKTPTGKAMPMNPMLSTTSPAIAHWSTCTDPNRFRKAKTKP